MFDPLDPPPGSVPDGSPAAGPPDSDDPALHQALQRPTLAERVVSFIEVVFCSGVPSQVVLALALQLMGWTPLTPSGELSLRYVATISLLDTWIILGLVSVFLRARGETFPGVMFSDVRPWREIAYGIASVPLIVLAIGAIGYGLRESMPWLHNVPENPLAALLRTPSDIAVFTVVVVVAGGVREEVQRAFVLHRFRQHLGGALAGLAIFSAAFGLGHLVQGYDAAIMTALLGLTWGAFFLRRGSIVAPMVSHALFNLLEVAREVATR